MNNLKQIMKAGLPIIVTYILNYVIIIITAIVYILLGNQDLDLFMNDICPHIFNIYSIGIILYLYQKNYQKEPKIHKYFPNIYLGISLAIVLNMFIFKVIPSVNENTISLPVAIISSGIIGPIYEEILFRYVFYNRLKGFYQQKVALLITNIIFALIHISPIKIIYAFLVGFVLTLIYEKDKNIMSPILVHCAANTIVLFLQEYNTYILLLSLINLMLSIKLIKEKNISKIN